jgi:Tfp pilus assembly protein PilF
LPGPSIRGPLALARLSERHGETEQAERFYQAMIKKSPQNPTPYHRLGAIRAKEGNFQAADEYFTQALQLDPTNAVLLSDAGYLYYLQNRPAEAEAILRQALEIKPSDPTICNNLAMLLGEQGRCREALTMFKRAGTEAQAYANLAFVYVQQGEFDKAEKGYSRALTLDRNLRPAAEALTQLARYEPMFDRAPTHEWAPAPESQLASQAGRLTDEGPQAGQLETHEWNAQQATFLAEESQTGVAAATDLSQSASFEQDASAAEVRFERFPAAFDKAPEQADLWQGLDGVVSEPQ